MGGRPTALPRQHNGSTTVVLPCWCGNSLCLQGFYDGSGGGRVHCGLPGALLANPILLAGQRTGLEEASPALQPGAGGDVGLLLAVRQPLGVPLRRGSQPRPMLELQGGPWIAGPRPEPTDLLSILHGPNPISAASAPESGVEALPGGIVKRAVGAAAAWRYLGYRPCLSPLGILSLAGLHNWSCDAGQRRPAAGTAGGTAESP